MNWFESLILGLVQGLTEFLPISSSAHLRLTAAFAGWQDPGAAFTAVTQIGTEAAVLIYFRKDIGRILSAWFRSLTDKSMRGDQDARLGWLVIVGSVPIGVLGVTLKDQIEGPFRDLRLTATMLIVLGVVLGVADRLAARAQEGAGTAPPCRARHWPTWASRTAWCSACARRWRSSRGLPVRRDDQRRPVHELHARVRRPVLLPARHPRRHGVRGLRTEGREREPRALGPTIFATVIAFGVGYAVIAWFMKFITTKSFMPFVVYRIGLGLVLLALIWLGVLSPTAGQAAAH